MKTEDLIRKSFEYSKRGQIIGAIEVTFLFGLLGLSTITVGLSISYLIDYFMGHLSDTPFLSTFNVNFILVITIVALIYGYSRWREARGCLIVWRFFKPTDSELRLYIGQRKRDNQKKIEDNIVRIKEIENDVIKSVANITRWNKDLESENNWLETQRGRDSVTLLRHKDETLSGAAYY